MQNKSKSNIKVFFIISIFLIIADQITKVSVKGFDLFFMSHEGMYLGESIPVIGDFLRWTFVENEGMAFGISFGWAKIFLSLFSVVASIILGIFLNKIRDEHWGVKLGVSLILAGAVGNLIDRVFYGVFYGESPLFYGRVVDFVQVDIPDVNFAGLYYTHFPVFNIADSSVTIGVITLLIFSKYIPDISKYFGRKVGEQEATKAIQEGDMSLE